MQQRINVNKPVKIKAIFLKGSNKPLRDRIAWIAVNFLVVAQDENDQAPTWYNVDQISRLEGVEIIPEQPKKMQLWSL